MRNIWLGVLCCATLSRRTLFLGVNYGPFLESCSDLDHHFFCFLQSHWEKNLNFASEKSACCEESIIKRVAKYVDGETVYTGQVLSLVEPYNVQKAPTDCMRLTGIDGPHGDR